MQLQCKRLFRDDIGRTETSDLKEYVAANPSVLEHSFKAGVVLQLKRKVSCPSQFVHQFSFHSFPSLGCLVQIHVLPWPQLKE